MLSITVPEGELYDEAKQEFISTKSQMIRLEHSLVSISKWESRWCKPFLETKEKTPEEIIDYVKCMTITQNVDPNIYYFLSKKNIDAINKYISSPMTATTFSSMERGGANREKVTSELIYYWMVAFNIPFECQKWHLNRLITLIKICNIKNSPTKKKSQREIMASNAALNAARKKKYNTHG